VDTARELDILSPRLNRHPQSLLYRAIGYGLETLAGEMHVHEDMDRMDNHQNTEETLMRQMNSMDKTGSIEESHTAYKGYFPEELPARERPPPAVGGTWQQRMKGFWTFSLSSYSIIHTPDRAARIRHIAMITILVLRTAMSGLSILSAVIKGSIAGIVIYSLLAILSMWFTATCLAIIGDAEGDKLLGRLVVVSFIHFL
jgi:hypothetical protein